MAIHLRIAESFERGECLVVACSALKQKYRDTLEAGVAVTWVYLKGTKDLIQERLRQRQHHFMKTGMPASQFADLEEPANAIVIGIGVEPTFAVAQIVNALNVSQIKDS